MIRFKTSHKTHRERLSLEQFAEECNSGKGLLLTNVIQDEGEKDGYILSTELCGIRFNPNNNGRLFLAATDNSLNEFFMDGIGEVYKMQTKRGVYYDVYTIDGIKKIRFKKI